MINLRILLLFFVCTIVWWSPARGALVADSVMEFSGTQGQDNWFYGYYDGALNPANFTLMSDFNPASRPNSWVVDNDLPSPIFYTGLDALGGHPNAISAGRDDAYHFVARRWIAENTGSFTLMGNIADLDFNLGANGVIGHIFVGGTLVYSQTILEGDLVGGDYNINVNATAGTAIDFVIDPNGESDLFDSTRYTATIFDNVVPEPSSFLLVGCASSFLLLRRRRA